MASTKTARQTAIAHLLLLAVVIVWGTTFSLVKAALANTTPMLFNLLRMTLAFAILAAVNGPVLRGLGRAELKLGAAAGVLLGLGYQLQTAGLAHTTATRSAFLTGLVVVIVPLLSALPRLRAAGARRPPLDAYLGAALAFAGLVLLTTPSGSGYDLLAGMHLGEWLSLGCAVAFAGHLLVLARAAPLASAAASWKSARRLGTLQIGFAALLMLLTLPLGGRITFHPAPELWLALGVTAVLATAAAFTIQTWAQQHLPPSHTALIFTLEPVFAWLTALLFFGERLGPRALAGAGLILAGILLAELSPLSRPTSGGGGGLIPITGA
jgi:drug/metabolite transporter (DMT)-like permease